MYNPEENKEIYNEILNDIENKSKNGIDAESALEHLTDNYNRKYDFTDKSLRMGSWIFVIFLILIGDLIAPLAGISEYLSDTASKAEAVGFNLSYSVIATAILALVVIFLFIKKHKLSIPAVKIFFFAKALIFAIGVLFTVEISNIELLLTKILQFVSFTVLAFVIMRYFNISRRVVRTFVYDKFQKVEKADKNIDRGFVLSFKEPSGLYVIIRYLIILVFIPLGILITFLTSIARLFY